MMQGVTRRAVPMVSVRYTAARGMASEKQMRDRIAATANIAKITKSMKMVAASRMRQDEARMKAGKPFGQMFARTMVAPDDFEAEDAPAAVAAEGGSTHLIVVNSSDRGLCGGINSGVAKFARKKAAELEAAGQEVVVACVGDKGRSQMSRTHSEKFVYTVDEHQKATTFATAATIAERIVGLDFDDATIVHNTFVSMIAYEQLAVSCPNLTPGEVGEGPLPDLCPPHLLGYEFEPEDKGEALQNLGEFAFAGSLYGAIIDGNAAEQSARMQAMENASKNAEEMIEKFTLAYNRLRQSRITTELIEIISGASALEGGED